MLVMAAHINIVVDIAIACVWAIAAALYYLSAYRHSEPVQDALRPVRLFGMWLSISWGVWYLIQAINGVEPDSAIHGITDGLLLVTATYIILISATSTRTLRKMGIR